MNNTLSLPKGQGLVKPSAKVANSLLMSQVATLPLVLEAARANVASGLSVIPIKADGTKAPAVASWKDYQKRLPSEAELARWFRDGCGLAIIGGAVSGNLEVLDFDEAGLFEEFESLAGDNGQGDLVRRCVLVKTPSGGCHLYYRSAEPVGGNKKLARTVSKQVRIETRGEGGYALAPPSPAACHPDLRPYILLRGDLTTLPVLSAEEVSILHRLARVFQADVEPERVHVMPTQGREKRHASAGLRPGDDYDQRGDVLSLLQTHGWQVRQRAEVSYLTRPAKTEPGISATFNVVPNRLYVFSSNALPFEGERAYSPFGVYGLLEHGGDFNAAAKALSEQGYGDRITPQAEFAEESLPSLQPPAEPKENEVLTFDAWKKRGKRLADWKRDVDETFRWRVADWYNMAIENVPHGEKEKFARSLFGDDLFRQVRNYASVAKRWPQEERQPELPFWLHTELAAHPREKREPLLQEFRERGRRGSETPGLTRDELRQRLGTIPTVRPLHWWQILKRDLSSALGEQLALAIQREGAFAVQQKLKAVLGIEAYDPAEPPADYRTDTDLIRGAQEHIEHENEAVNFHAGVKPDELDKDLYGARGEIALRRILACAGVSSTWLPLVADRPQSGADFVIEEIRFDSKACDAWAALFEDEPDTETAAEDDAPMPLLPTDHAEKVALYSLHRNEDRITQPAVLQFLITPDEEREALTTALARCQHPNNPDELDKDLYGARGEIALRRILACAGVSSTWLPLVADRPQSGADFVIEEIRFDSKACRPARLPEKDFATVNQAGHDNPAKRPAYYVLSLFTSPCRFTLAIIPAEDIDARRNGWRLMTNRPKPYYSTHRRNLTPISSLSAFLEAVETAKASLSANQEYEEGVI